MPVKDNMWAKILTVEMFASIVMTAFLVGGAWIGLSQAQEVTADKANDNGKKLETLEANVQAMQVDVAVTKTKTESIEKQVHAQGETVNEIRNMLMRAGYSAE